jgi:HSP20 family molecular chaperone IbpA
MDRDQLHHTLVVDAGVELTNVNINLDKDKLTINIKTAKTYFSKVAQKL